MFNSKKSVIFITKSKVKITAVTLGGKPKENPIGEFEWSPENFLNNLETYKKNIGNSARILLSEDFVYVVVLTFPESVILNRTIILEKAQELIPQNLNETIWDFKEVLDIPSSKDHLRKIQVAATVKSLFENLSKLIYKSGLNIETVEPLSFALARLAKNQEKPILFIYIYDKAYLVLVKNEIVFETQILDLPIDAKKLDKFISFTKEQSQIMPDRIIFGGNTSGINLKEYESKNYKTEIQNLSPAISSSYKKTNKDNDEKELNLELLKNFKLDEKPVSVRKHTSNFLIFAIFFFAGVIIFEILFYLFFVPK